VEDTTNEIINLGDKIELSGFKVISSGEMIIVRKIVGSQVRKFQEFIPDFERLSIHLKPVHKTEQHMKFELHANLIHAGKPTNTETTNRNLFMGLSELFSNFESMLNKK
jgi:ribosome-associated translation inhibitor RaiA